MNFILIFGPPAVGKMAVGNAIREKAGIPLFHNHLSIEPALLFFPFGSPSFNRFVKTFRESIFEESIASGLIGLSFTCVWNLDDEEDCLFIKDTCERFENAGAQVTIVELKAELSQRLLRNRSEARLLEKPSKRDTDASELRLLKANEICTMNSVGKLPLKYKHIIIDNTHLLPGEVADLVISELGLTA